MHLYIYAADFKKINFGLIFFKTWKFLTLKKDSLKQMAWIFLYEADLKNNVRIMTNETSIEQ